MKRALRLLFLSLLALVVTAGIALALIVKLVLAPSAGEWATDVGPQALRITVGVPTTIRLATSPWFAPHLAGRSFDTAHGTLHVDWDEATQSLTLRCGPCAVDVPALGAQPIRVAQLRTTVRRDGHLLNGRFEATPDGDAEPPLAGRWDGRLSQKGLQLAFDADDAPIARWYRVIGASLPELKQARIGGTLGLHAELGLPGGAVALRPRIAAFTVEGLGSEALLGARSSCGRAITRP